jgi:hypothetical protein
VSTVVARGASGIVKPPVGGRGLRSYLLLPRPADMIKAWILPTTFVFGVLAQGGADSRQLLRAAVVWVALELLLYQARYQWNDIRGFAADQRHPHAERRGRLPGPPERGRQHVGASRAVLCARLAAVALLVALLPSLRLAAPLAALTAAVFGLALVYEALRSLATGDAGRVPPPVRPKLVALWIVAGGGYAIRGVSGLALCTDLTSRPLLALAALVATWSFGVAFVTSRWALEGLSFAHLSRDGRIAWGAEPDQAREHSLALARWLPGSLPVAGSGRVGVAELEDWPALRAGIPLSAPWNLAALVAAAAAAAAGSMLAGPSGAGEALLAAACGALLAVAALIPAGRRWPAWMAAGVALVLLLAASGSARPVLAALPWLTVVGAHLLFTAQTLRTVPHPLRALAGGISAPIESAESQPVPVAPLSRRWR